jgi:hypothetical protein
VTAARAARRGGQVRRERKQVAPRVRLRACACAPHARARLHASVVGGVFHDHVARAACQRPLARALRVQHSGVQAKLWRQPPAVRNPARARSRACLQVHVVRVRHLQQVLPYRRTTRDRLAVAVDERHPYAANTAACLRTSGLPNERCTVVRRAAAEAALDATRTCSTRPCCAPRQRRARTRARTRACTAWGSKVRTSRRLQRHRLLRCRCPPRSPRRR